MSELSRPTIDAAHAAERLPEAQTVAPRRRLRRWPAGGWVGVAMLILLGGPCLVTLPWSVQSDYYDGQQLDWEATFQPPSSEYWLGTDGLGRSLLWRCLLGGAISLGIGVASATIALLIGVSWGAAAGYAGGALDAVMMRTVDILYGLPYVLLVVLLTLALKPAVAGLTTTWLGESVGSSVADVFTLLLAIGGVSWLTMARVIRGQVLSLRARPFIEAARAMGLGPFWILRKHVLPNLVGPIVVYATLTVPAAILQESFLSFLGIGVRAPLPSWGNLAAEGVYELHGLGVPEFEIRWWLIVFPATLLGLTLLALNFVGEALRKRYDPHEAD